MKPIPTEYNGTIYRSRTEAKWAYFFTENGIPFIYENEGYDFGRGFCYCPDFLLRDAKVWFEVKPFDPTNDELEKAKALARASGRLVFIAPGTPEAEIKIIGISPSGAMRGNFSFAYAHEQGVGYLTDSLCGSSNQDQIDIRIVSSRTNPVGRYGCGPDVELNEAGKMQFSWRKPKIPDDEECRVVFPRERSIVRDGPRAWIDRSPPRRRIIVPGR